MLAKAVAHYFEAKLLLLDVTDFSLKVSGGVGLPVLAIDIKLGLYGYFLLIFECIHLNRL